MIGVPILRTTSVTVVSGGKRLPGREADLKNPSNDPMVITEVRFRSGSSNDAASMRCRFTLNGMHLTDYVHVWSFDPLSDPSQYGNPNGNLLSMDENHVWRPVCPILVPKNGYLAPEFFNSSEVSAASRTIQVTYAGYVWPREQAIPSRIRVPWVSSFVGTSNLGNVDTTDKSRSIDIHNPWETQVDLRYLICRSYSTLSAVNTREANLRFGKLRITASRGLPDSIVRDPTPLAHLAHVTDSSWNLNGTSMPPKSYWTVHVESTLSSLSDVGVWRPYVALVGDREVRSADL